ncbi:MAG: EndoU domain-containing protein [Myxococcales bacterium]|nr:EndoU domain-containing protein [Myxococcales bacterium]
MSHDLVGAAGLVHGAMAEIGELLELVTDLPAVAEALEAVVSALMGRGGEAVAEALGRDLVRAKAGELRSLAGMHVGRVAHWLGYQAGPLLSDLLMAVVLGGAAGLLAVGAYRVGKELMDGLESVQRLRRLALAVPEGREPGAGWGDLEEARASIASDMAGRRRRDRSDPEGAEGPKEVPSVSHLSDDEARERLDALQRMFATGEGKPPGFNKKKSALRAERAALKRRLRITHDLPLPRFTGRIREEHIFRGELTRSAGGQLHAKGLHHESGAAPETHRLTRLSEADEKGVYTVMVELRDPESGEWIRKASPSSMFPRDWSPERVLDEIRSARATAGQVPNGPSHLLWEGESESGLVIRGFMNEDGDITSAFPLGTET